MSDWLFQSKNLTLGAGEKMAGVDAKRTEVEADAEATIQRVGSPDRESSELTPIGGTAGGWT
jgi:hypothetical protein